MAAITQGDAETGGTDETATKMGHKAERGQAEGPSKERPSRERSTVLENMDSASAIQKNRGLKRWEFGRVNRQSGRSQAEGKEEAVAPSASVVRPRVRLDTQDAEANAQALQRDPL